MYPVIVGAFPIDSIFKECYMNGIRHQAEEIVFNDLIYT